MKLSENQKKNLYISKLNSKVLDVINRTVQKKNYDYCTAGVTRMQFFFEWKKAVVCGKGKLYAGVLIQDKSFCITVEPYKDFENWKEKYSFKKKNNSSEIYIKTARWENKILEELSGQFDFLIKGKPRQEPYRYNDFKFMKCDMKEGATLSELAKAVDVTLKLIIKNSGSLIDLNFDFIIS